MPDERKEKSYVIEHRSRSSIDRNRASVIRSNRSFEQRFMRTLRSRCWSTAAHKEALLKEISEGAVSDEVQEFVVDKRESGLRPGTVKVAEFRLHAFFQLDSQGPSPQGIGALVHRALVSSSHRPWAANDDQ